jgi:hypothetical protein
MKKKRYNKPDEMLISQSYLDQIKPGYTNKGYSIPKWITFCEVMLQNNWKVILHEAKSTHSKYIYASKNDKKVKVRFSDHLPNKNAQDINDSDYYVGVSHYGCIRTEELIDKLNPKEDLI